MSEKLTICFNPWMIFHDNDDYDDVISQIAERGFNCIRIESGAGIVWDKNGNVREDVLILPPFGKYTEDTTYKVMVEKKRINVLDRLLRVCKAAKKQNVKVILSCWFFLHTNWFLEDADVEPIYALSTEEKMSHFADDLSRILDVLQKEGLKDIIAFAEIFNEFEGLPFAGNYGPLSVEAATGLRILHEKEIEKLKKNHPDTLFAFDTSRPTIISDLIPRNIDVLNFHSYFLWPIYHEFEKGLIKGQLEDLKDIPPETRYFLKDEILSVKEISESMGHCRAKSWPRRISLYSSVDEQKENELAMFLDSKLKENFEFYRKRLYDGFDKIVQTHDAVVPNSRLVMGEGATYCSLPTLTFERDSQYFWTLLKEQMEYANEKGLWGTVIATTHGPERNAAWESCKNLYIELNKIFLK